MSAELEPKKEKKDGNTTEMDDIQEAETIKKTKQLKRQQALVETRSLKDSSNERMFNRFNTVIDEMEEIKQMIEKNKKTAEAKDWRHEKKISSITTDIKKLERSITSISNSVSDLSCTLEANSVRVGMLEEKQFNLSLSVKGVEKRTSKRISELVDWIKINLENRTDQSTPFKSTPNLKKTDELNTIREEVKISPEYATQPPEYLMNSLMKRTQQYNNPETLWKWEYNGTSCKSPNESE